MRSRTRSLLVRDRELRDLIGRVGFAYDLARAAHEG